METESEKVGTQTETHSLTTQLFAGEENKFTHARTQIYCNITTIREIQARLYIHTHTHAHIHNTRSELHHAYDVCCGSRTTRIDAHFIRIIVLQTPSDPPSLIRRPHAKTSEQLPTSGHRKTAINSEQNGEQSANTEST